MGRISLSVVLIFLFSASHSLARSAGPDFAIAQGATISGTVVVDGTQAPLADVPVAAFSLAVQVAVATTNASGQYTMAGLPPGAYRVRTALEQSTYVNEWQDGLCFGCPGTPAAVVVGAETSVGGIDFSLTDGGAISGQIVAHPALANVPVATYSGDVQVATASTNTSGGISGRVTCDLASNPRYISPPVIDVFNSAGVLVRRRSPRRFEVCQWTSGNMQYPGAVFSDFVFEDLPTGQYFLLAWDLDVDLAEVGAGAPHAGGLLIDKLYGDIVCVAMDCDVRRGVPVSVIAGSTTTGIDFRMTLGAMSNGPVFRYETLPLGPETKLAIFDARGVPLRSGTAINSICLVIGQIRYNCIYLQWVVGIPPGTYFVKYGSQLHDGIPCHDCPPTSGTPIVVHPGEWFPDMHFGNPPVRRIGGAVMDEVGGGPLSTATVEVLSGAGHVVARAATDLSGHYSAGPLAPGTYYVRALGGSGYLGEVYDNHLCAGCDPRTGTPVIVGAGSDVGGIDFALAAGGAGGMVSGVVTDTAGVPLGMVPVSFFAAEGTTVGRTASGDAGQFQIALPAGSYRARAEASAAHGAEIFSEQPCTSVSCDATAGTPVVVTDGAITTNINFTLASCSAMTLSPPLLASGVVGRNYRQVFSTTGGVGPFAFQVTEGVLPLGMALAASSGVLDGTPSVSGRHAFSVGAVDAAGCATARAYTLDVQACAFTLSPSSATLPAAGGTVKITIGDACGPQTVTGVGTFVHEQSNTAGQVVLAVDAHVQPAPRTADLTIGRRVFTIQQLGSGSAPPFGVLDIPLDGAQVSGSIALGGWALDDLEVRRVVFFRDPVEGEPAVQIFVGTALFVPGARPDVERAYPGYPHSERAGWGFMVLTNMLPNQGNGMFRIYAYAEDADGGWTLLGARTIVANNAGATLPFGTIDRPAQGETIAGSAYLNWGWALTPQPKIIPTDGSTVRVYVDGVALGTVTYNLFRPDVSGLFPGLANSGGPVGYRVLDTTAFAEGLHTISWVVTDSLDAVAGIGSRYFSVANSADAQPVSQSAATAATTTGAEARARAGSPAPVFATGPGPDSLRYVASLADVPVSEAPVSVQRGEGIARPLRARNDGSRAVRLAGLERLTLTLGEAGAACAGTWAGYLVDRETLRHLPVGAALDPTGTFYWQPGPGFMGTFELLFVRTACDGRKERIPLVVILEPPR